MALSGVSVDEVKRLIDRGLASDATFPRGTGYLLSTGDKARNVRATLYPAILSPQPEVPTPGKNQKRVLYGGLNLKTGHLTGYWAASKSGRSLRAVPGGAAG